MTYLLILILFAVIFVPLAKALWAIFSQVRKVRQFMNDPTSYFRGAYGAADNNGRSKKKKKKFEPNEGEYIEFTEISCNTTTQSADGSTTTSYTREEQVTDIEWEDIK